MVTGYSIEGLLKDRSQRLTPSWPGHEDSKSTPSTHMVRTGHKLWTSKALKEAKDRLLRAGITGYIAQGRLGLGCSARLSWKKADPREGRGLVQREVSKAEDKQGSWTRWEHVKGRALTQQDIWSMEGNQIKFLLCSVYDVLPTPSNLHTWGLSENFGCTHCGRLANLEHVLSSWPSSLADGKYRWRHGKILAQWVDGVKKAMSTLLHPLCESGRECSSRGKEQSSLGNSM